MRNWFGNDNTRFNVFHGSVVYRQYLSVKSLDLLVSGGIVMLLLHYN